MCLVTMSSPVALRGWRCILAQGQGRLRRAGTFLKCWWCSPFWNVLPAFSCPIRCLASLSGAHNKARSSCDASAGRGLGSLGGERLTRRRICDGRFGLHPGPCWGLCHSFALDRASSSSFRCLGGFCVAPSPATASVLFVSLCELREWNCVFQLLEQQVNNVSPFVSNLCGSGAGKPAAWRLLFIYLWTASLRRDVFLDVTLWLSLGDESLGSQVARLVAR